MDQKVKFPIKGFREGLLVSMGEGDWQNLTEELFAQIDGNLEFFEGAKMAVDVDERKLKAAEVSKLRDKLADRKVTLFAILSKSAATETVAETFGLSTKKSDLKTGANEIPRALHGGENALLLRKTLRSGAAVKFAGDVIVDGDVNPGAEITASGSIYVWGKLRGTAHAGIEGSKNEVIAALEIETSNLRIANIDYQEPKLKVRIKKKAEKAFIDGKNLKIVDWDQYKRLE
jgi:septum site-determining protein MinC